MKNKVNLAQAEEILATTYAGKWCTFDYPGYKQVYGMVDLIGIDSTKSEPLVAIQMNGKKYTCSVPDLKDCLKLL